MFASGIRLSSIGLSSNNNASFIFSLVIFSLKDQQKTDVRSCMNALLRENIKVPLQINLDLQKKKKNELS